jgi:RHS repeat-associated protein
VIPVDQTNGGGKATGLDYFGARYFSGAQGRFTSPDKPFADQHAENPQSWNLYTYTLNNPLRYVDPNGEGVVEGAAKWVDRTGLAFVSLVLEPEKTIPRVASGVWNAVSNPGQTLRNIGQGLRDFANSSLDDKITVATEIALDAGVVALTGGAGRAGSGMTTLKELPALANAQNALEATVAVTSSKTATVVGAYDVQTGAVAVGKSGAGLNPVNPQVAAAAQRAGGLGTRNPGVPGVVGQCAECNAANTLANQGSNVKNVRFTPAVRPRTGEVVPKCPNCEKMFPNQ